MSRIPGMADTALTGIPETLRHLAVPLASLTPHPRNPRRGNVELIKDSLTRFGQFRPLIVQARTNQLIAGHHTFYAAQQLGWEQVAVTFLDVDDDTAARICLMDNAASDQATYDHGVLADLLTELSDTPSGLDGTGFDQGALDALIAEMDLVRQREERANRQVDPDDVPDTPSELISQTGDIWALGRHRVICGDSTDPATLAALMDGALADCMWTDPPYGVEIVGATGMSREVSAAERKARGGQTIQNDGADDLPDLLERAFKAATEALLPGAAVYAAAPAGPLTLVFGNTMQAIGWTVRQQLAWVKDSMVMGRSDYHYRHEPIWMAYTPNGQGRLGRGGPRWHGDDSATSVFEIPRPKRSAEHPTMKPVALIQAMITNSSPLGGRVIDPFGGSGSTLIACQETGRTAYLSEIDPRYVDVICARYQRLTGEMPVRASDGQAVDFLADADVSAA